VKLEALDHVGVLVSDIDRSIEWYQRVLGLKRAVKRVYEDTPSSNPAVLVANGTGVSLFPAAGEPDAAATFRPPAHVCFRLSGRGFQSARTELERAGIKYWESDHHVSRSLYIQDPDSHLIEITTYQIPAETPSASKSKHETPGSGGRT
jgi:catechol 2,3-dioxygenase-like lactoylglutathione lyase family enzyme